MKQITSVLDKLVVPLLVLGGILVVLAFILNFTVAPIVYSDAMLSVPILIGDKTVTNYLLFSQKIFYFHMPVALVSMAALVFTALYGILFLRTRDSKYDMRARTATEISLVFVLMTMATGLAWTRHDWGVWWSWEPRLTTYFILMLMVIGYFILRTAVADPERRATYCAVFGIIIAINVPICMMITRIIPSTHPVLQRGDSGLSPTMLLPLLLALVGFCCLGFGLYRWRLHIRQMEDTLETLKLRLDDLEG